MQLGEKIATYDVALALRGESGKFDVTSPTGEIYHVTRKSGPFDYESAMVGRWCESAALRDP